jgi:hypothetical protein
MAEHRGHGNGSSMPRFLAGTSRDEMPKVRAIVGAHPVRLGIA